MSEPKYLDKVNEEVKRPRKLKIWEGSELETVKMIYMPRYYEENSLTVDPVEMNDRAVARLRNKKAQNI